MRTLLTFKVQIGDCELYGQGHERWGGGVDLNSSGDGDPHIALVRNLGFKL